MVTIEDLKKEYGTNNPIFLDDIAKTKEENTRVRRYLLDQNRRGNIEKFDRGIYYFATDTLFGKSTLSVMQVVRKKYIENKNNTFGYFTGLTARNQMRLSTQNPTTIFVKTNNTSTSRTITIKNKKVVLEKSDIKINKTNEKELQFLDVLNDLPEYIFKENYDYILNYIEENNLNIQNYISLYPTVAINLIKGDKRYGTITS